jgi:hypothetical protein
VTPTAAQEIAGFSGNKRRASRTATAENFSKAHLGSTLELFSVLYQTKPTVSQAFPPTAVAAK